MDFPQSADIVIIGGGVMGASTAYHLARRGMTDILLLEKQEFFGMGATGRCAGGIRYQFSTEINIRLSQLSLPMLDRFEEETGQAIDLRKIGYLLLATTDGAILAKRGKKRGTVFLKSSHCPGNADARNSSSEYATRW